MALPVPSRDEMLNALHSASDRFIAQLRTGPDAKRTAIGYWDVGTVAAHVGHIFDLYPGIARGEGTPIADHRKVAEHWDARVADDPERDLGILAKKIEAGRDLFSDAVLAAEWQDTVTWLGNLRVPMWSLPGVLINESEVHGRDIALATDTSWSIPAQHACLAIAAHVPFLYGFVNEEATRGLNASFGLHVRGGDDYYFKFTDGQLSIDGAKTAVDCHISTDPVAYLLLGYGRTSQWGSIATGKVLTWGRKPWLSLKFAKLFQSV